MARYTNLGVVSGLFPSGSIDTDAAKTTTGTAVYNLNSETKISVETVGFSSNETEIWLRYDVYSINRYTRFGVYFENNQYVGFTNTKMYYYDAGGSRVTTYINNSDFPTGEIVKFSLHVSTNSAEFYINDTQVLSFSAITQGTKITHFFTYTSTDRVSNIIVANYNCLNETLIPVLHADTARMLAAAVSLNADTERFLSAGVVINGDTRRILPVAVPVLHGDTERKTTATVNLAADTERTVAVSVHLHGDTSRAVTGSVTIHADTERALPFAVSFTSGTGGINNVTMTLAEKTLSDTFRLMSATPYNLQDVIQGGFFDFAYKFRVESTSQRDLMQTVNGTYDVDELLYNPIKYHVNPADKHAYYPKRTNTQSGQQVLYGITAGQVAELCCEGINKTAVCYFDDFFPSSAQDDVITNYQSVLSGVFGWTAQVPRKQINVFMRGNNVYFLQREYEIGVIDLDAYTHSRPTYDRSLVRTMWARRADFYDSMNGSTGIWGDWYIESISDPDINHGGNGTTPPDVTLDSSGLVERTVEHVDNEDGELIITTDYEYTDTGRSKFLTREIQTTRQNGEIIEQRTIDHYPLENGQRYSVGTDADGNTSSGLGTYPYADSMNRYAGEIWKLTRGGRWVTNNGDTIADSNSFPVNDRATIEAIYSELKWMNRRTMERVTVDIIGTEAQGISSVNTVFDFFYRYELGGNEYFLVSNTVSYTSRQFIQTLNLVRWY